MTRFKYKVRNLVTLPLLLGMGLGGKMVQRGLEIAKEQDCDYVRVLVSGIYSKAIFKKAGFTDLFEVEYESVKDLQGKTLIWDHREHPSLTGMYIKIE